MQNDKELSFRIYSAGAAQKPNRLELEDGATTDQLGAFTTLEAFYTLGDEIAGAILLTETLRLRVGDAGKNDANHFKLFVTELRNAMLFC